METIPPRRRRKGTWYASLMALIFLTAFVFVVTKFLSQVKHATQEELRDEVIEVDS